MMSSEVIHHHDKTTQDYCPTYGSHGPWINDEHASILDLVKSVPGWLRPEDALKLYEMAYFADGPILEIGCYHGKSTTIMARAIQAAGRSVPLVSLDINSKNCAIAEAHVKQFAPEASVQFHTGTSTDLLRRLDLDPAFVFIDGDHSYEGVKSDLEVLMGKVRDDGFLLLHDFFDSRNDDPDQPDYGVSHAAWEVLDTSLFRFSGRFGCTALFQKTAVESTSDTYQLNTAEALGALQSAPENEALLQAVVTALVNHLSLPEYGIDWNEDQCVVPEIWMLDPRRRFEYFSRLAIYDFACRFAEGKRVLDVGGGVGYGGYYLVTRGAGQVGSLDVDEQAYRYGRDRYKNKQLRFFLGPIESLVGQSCEAFDFILCSHVMEHLADYRSALDSVHALLAPNGLYLQVTAPKSTNRVNPQHVNPFPLDQWREILASGFSQHQCFSQIPLRDEADTNSQFDFHFAKLKHDEAVRPQGTANLILCKKSSVASPDVHHRFSRTSGPLALPSSSETTDARNTSSLNNLMRHPRFAASSHELTSQTAKSAREGSDRDRPGNYEGPLPNASLPSPVIKAEHSAATLLDEPDTHATSTEQLQRGNEPFVPLLGLELEPYLETENKNGIHHLGRYLWAVEVLRQRQPKRVLDLACGVGFGSYLLARDVPGTTVVGADYEASAVDHAQRTYHHENLRYVPSDLAQWDLGEFDAIISFDTIDHVRHREIMLQIFVEHLSPDGCLLLSTPIRSKMILNPDGEHHAIAYTSGALLNFLRRYFTRVHRPEDGTLPCAGFFDRINCDRTRYKLMTNPLVCEGPIRQ